MKLIREWVYPIFAAFRLLAGSAKSGGEIAWKKEPIHFWQKHAQQISERYFPHIVSAGYEPRKIATNLLTYQAMRQAVSDLYKDELLAEAGITA